LHDSESQFGFAHSLTRTDRRLDFSVKILPNTHYFGIKSCLYALCFRKKMKTFGIVLVQVLQPRQVHRSPGLNGLSPISPHVVDHKRDTLKYLVFRESETKTLAFIVKAAQILEI